MIFLILIFLLSGLMFSYSTFWGPSSHQVMDPITTPSLNSSYFHFFCTHVKLVSCMSRMGVWSYMQLMMRVLILDFWSRRHPPHSILAR